MGGPFTNVVCGEFNGKFRLSNILLFMNSKFYCCRMRLQPIVQFYSVSIFSPFITCIERNIATGISAILTSILKIFMKWKLAVDACVTFALLVKPLEMSNRLPGANSQSHSTHPLMRLETTPECWNMWHICLSDFHALSKKKYIRMTIVSESNFNTILHSFANILFNSLLSITEWKDAIQRREHRKQNKTKLLWRIEMTQITRITSFFLCTIACIQPSRAPNVI